MEEHPLLSSEGDKKQFNPSPPIIIEGKKAKRRRGWRVFLMVLKHSLFSIFLTISRFNQDYLVKYLLPLASLPLEMINLFSEIKNIVDKQKPFWVFIQTVLLSVFSISLLVINSLIKWNQINNNWLMSLVGLGPIYFTCINAAFAFLELSFLIQLGINFYSHPEFFTPHRKLNFINRIVKIIALSTMASVMLPFTAAVKTLTILPFFPPFTLTLASVLGVTLGLMLGGLFVMKIVKTIHENQAWKNTANHLKTSHQDPYDLLNINRVVLEHKIDLEIQNRKGVKNYFKQLGVILTSGWNGSQNTAVAYIDKCFTHTVAQHPEKLRELQETYDLIRKARGRLKYEKMPIEQLREAALQRDQYSPIFHKLKPQPKKTTRVQSAPLLGTKTISR